MPSPLVAGLSGPSLGGVVAAAVARLRSRVVRLIPALSVGAVPAIAVVAALFGG